MKMNTKKLGTLALLAVFVLVFTSAGSVMANVPGESTDTQSDTTLLEQSLKHYVMALEAYNDGNYGKVKGQLQAAASNAKHVDSDLANLLLQAADCLPLEEVSFTYIAGELANVFNGYNSQYSWGYPMFDPGNPTAAPPGEGMT